MGFGWEGQKVRLIPLEREKHFDNAIRWLNDPDVTQWTLVGDFPLTRLAEEEFFQRVAKQNDTDIAFAIETPEEEHIGFSGIHQLSFRHGTAVTGTIIGRKPLWGHGYGSDAIAVRTRYAFEVLGLRLLMSEVMAENTASYRALLKNGYHETARIPQRYWKRGAYRDVIQMLIARAEWKP